MLAEAGLPSFQLTEISGRFPFRFLHRFNDQFIDPLAHAFRFRGYGGIEPGDFLPRPRESHGFHPRVDGHCIEKDASVAFGPDIEFDDPCSLLSLDRNRDGRANVVNLIDSGREWKVETLVAVVETDFGRPRTFLNAYGESVITQKALLVYGHLRPSSLQRNRGEVLKWSVGQQVFPNDVVGYVEHRTLNGHGDEHLHFGLRLQPKIEAIRVDPSAWFRGYERNTRMGRFLLIPFHTSRGEWKKERKRRSSAVETIVRFQLANEWFKPQKVVYGEPS